MCGGKYRLEKWGGGEDASLVAASALSSTGSGQGPGGIKEGLKQPMQKGRGGQGKKKTALSTPETPAGSIS